MIQDPSGLLERVPELQPICDDARVRAAVEQGDPFAVYRALVLGRLTGRLRKHRDAVKNLLSNRRPFAKPMKSGSGPFLGTFNGFGATLMGSAEKDGTTHIATHVAVAIFFLPLFPFGAYVVSPGQGGVMHRSWSLYARVPLTLGTWLWQRSLSVAALVAILYAGYGAFHATQHHVLHVLNGLGEPVKVTVGTATLDVPAGGRQVVDLPVGTVSGSARLPSGLEVDRQEIRVKSGSQKLVWNVLGAAPLTLELVRYTSERTQAREENGPEPTVYCGRRVVSVPDVDFAFTDPPSSVSMPKGSKVIVRQHLDVVPTQGRKGIDLCTAYLVGEGKPKEALPLIELASRTSGWELGPTWTLLYVANAVEPEHALALAEEALRAHPESVIFHRLYQVIASFRMGEADLVARYKARAEAAPGSAEAQYLYLRLVRGPEAVEAVRAAAARFPRSPDLLRFLVHAESSSGRWKQAHEAYQRLSEMAPEEAGHVLEQEMTALVALGRVPEARTRLLQSFPTWKEDVQTRAAVLDARLAGLSRASDGERLLGKLEPKTVDAVLRVRAGLPGALEIAPDGSLATFQRTVLTAPAKVPAVAAALPILEVTRLSDGEWALAWGECARLGDQACRRSLEGYLRFSAYDLADLARFVRGESAELTTMVEPTVRAAALLVRSRNPAFPAEERERLVADARRADWLHDEITDAIPAWTRPAAR